METVAYFATYRHYHGMAMRTQTNDVWFRHDATGQWQQLFDSDIPDLTLHGRVDLAAAQAVADGDVYTWIERRNTEHARVAA
jgi:hypothetical protein